MIMAMTMVTQKQMPKLVQGQTPTFGWIRCSLSSR